MLLLSCFMLLHWKNLSNCVSSIQLPFTRPRVVSLDTFSIDENSLTLHSYPINFIVHTHCKMFFRKIWRFFINMLLGLHQFFGSESVRIRIKKCPDPGDYRGLQNWKNKSKDPFVIPKFIFCVLLLMIFKCHFERFS